MINKIVRKYKLKSLDYLIVIFFCLGVLSFLWSYFFIFSHSLVNVFAGGRSTIKTFLFIMYVIFLALIAKRSIKTLVIGKFDRWLCFITVIIGFVLGIYGYMQFVNSYDLSIKSWSVVFNNAEISSNSLMHNHTLKGAIGLILSFFGINFSENTDIGAAFNGMISNYIYIGALVAICVSVYGFIVFYYKKIRQIESKQKILYTIFYAIVTYSIAKNIVDGGFFNHEAMVSLAFLVYLLFDKERWNKYIFYLLLVLYPICQIYFYYFGFFDAGDNAKYTLINNLIDFTVYTSVLFAFKYFLENKYDRKGKLIIWTVVLMVVFVVIDDISIIGYRNMKINSDDNAYLGVYKKIDKSDYQEIAKIGDLYFYDVMPQESISVSKVLKEYKLKDNFYPMNFPYRNCFPKGLPQKYSYEIATKKAVEVGDYYDQMTTIKTVYLHDDNGIYHYNVSMSIGPCLPRHINIINELWKQRGYDNFVIANLKKVQYEH